MFFTKNFYLTWNNLVWLKVEEHTEDQSKKIENSNDLLELSILDDWTIRICNTI